MLLQLVLLSLLGLPHNSASALLKTNSSVTQSGIRAMIRDHNGIDITSSFQIRVYDDQISASNSTLHDRRTVSVRPINDCYVPNSYFRSSICIPTTRSGRSLSMQTWRIYCHVPHNIAHPETGELRTVWVGASRLGQCEDHETCVDSLDFNAYNQVTHVARCVNQEDYVFVNNSNLKEPYLKNGFSGRRANVMLSKPDRRTPLEVEELDVQAGTTEDLGQSERCQDCVGLHTDALSPDTESLKTEVKLLTTGAAVTGILWLALMSG